MLKKFWIEILVVAAIGVIASFAFANAASLRVCYDDASVTVDMASIQALADGAPLFADVLAGSTLSGTKRCSTQAIPASLARGKDVAVTLRAVNAYGEGGPASAPVSFHSPALPSAVTGATVSIVVP